MKIFSLILICTIYHFTIASESNSQEDTYSGILPESETTGACSKQLNPQLNKRNCRYGKCEQTKNGTDYVCHCDDYITGRKCDRPAKDPNDACSSNPCWGDSICITLETENREFRCLCPEFRRGKYCHVKLVAPAMIIDDNDAVTSVYNSSEVSDDSMLSSSTMPTHITTQTINYVNTTNESLNLTLIEPENNTFIPITKHPNTFVPSSEMYEACNYDTCQLGKCLKNGTCQCVHPAIGKFCDRIDECLVLKCVNGHCVTGKGCICQQGFMGTTCEIEANHNSSIPNSYLSGKVPYSFTPLRTIISRRPTNPKFSTVKSIRTRPGGYRPFFNYTTFIWPTSSITPSTVTTTTETITTTSTSTPTTTTSSSTTSTTTTTTTETAQTTTTSNLPSTSPSMMVKSSLTKANRVSQTIVDYSTTQPVTSCENGGLLIDNVCICLNQFSGVRCELVPGYSDPSLYSTNIIKKDNEMDLSTLLNIETATNSPGDVSRKFIQLVSDKASKMLSSLHQKPLYVVDETSVTKKVSSAESNTKIEETTSQSEKRDRPSSIHSNSENEDEMIPLFTLSRYNGPKGRNGTRSRQIYWPWFECFPGDSKVFVIDSDGKSVKSKEISSLEVDDKVLVSSNDENQAPSFSKVVSFFHRVENIDASFVRIYFNLKQNSSDNYITLTPRHLILVKEANDNQSDFEYKPAMKIKPGDELKYYDHETKFQKIVTVNLIETVDLKNSGIYAPLTETGTIIVDNIHVSCYSMVKNHRLAQFFFSLINNIGSVFDVASNTYVSYSKVLYEALNLLNLSSLFLNV